MRIRIVIRCVYDESDEEESEEEESDEDMDRD